MAVFLLVVLFVFLSTFYFWWLSYWLEQGSGVSALGVGGAPVARAEGVASLGAEPQLGTPGPAQRLPLPR